MARSLQCNVLQRCRRAVIDALSDAASDGDAGSVECDVFLVCPTLESSGALSASALVTVLGSSMSSASGDSWYRHWAAMFSYDDKSALYCEAACDPLSGDLVGASAWRNTQQLESLGASKVHLGKYKVSPARVLAIIKELSPCGKYHVTKNNCQKWVTSLLNRLGISVPEIPADAEQVVEKTVVPAATTMCGVVVAAVACSAVYRLIRS